MIRVLLAFIITFALLTALLPTTIAASTQTPPAPTPAATHVVERGDTLYAIAMRYGTTVEELKRVNRLRDDVIYVGQVLLIAASRTPAPGDTVYTVVRGDTLYSLARRYGTTVEAIMQANRLTGTNIYVGQRLLIATSPAPPAEHTVYTVVRGDTLYAIARRYGTTVNAIMAANHLSSTWIYVGQRLLIPLTQKTPAPIISTATPTATVTTTPTPTLTPPPTNVVIQSIFYNGVAPQESDEYAVIANIGSAPQNIGDWRLNAGDPEQNFRFPSFELAPGQTCRVYTNEDHPESCGFNFRIGTPIWNNEGECGYLYDARGAQVSEYCYEP